MIQSARSPRQLAPDLSCGKRTFSSHPDGAAVRGVGAGPRPSSGHIRQMGEPSEVVRRSGRVAMAASLVLGLVGFWGISPAQASPQEDGASPKVSESMKADASTGPRPMTASDVARLVEVDDPHFDPAGRFIAYTVGTENLEDDKSHVRAFMVSVEGGEPIPLTAPEGAVSKVRFSPDGRHISFLAGRDGAPQLYTLFRQGGEARQRTRLPQGVEDYAWAPDGRHLVLVIKDASEQEKEAAKRAEQAKKSGTKVSESEEKPRPWVTERRQFKQDYVGYLDDRRDHLYLLDLAAQEGLPARPSEQQRALMKPRQLTFGPYDDSEPTWSPDGRRLAFTSNRTEDPDGNQNTDIWIVEPFAAATKPTRPGEETGPPLLQVTQNPGSDNEPAWSPDGTRLVHITVVDVERSVYATQHVGLTAAAGGTTRLLTAELDQWCSAPRFAPDGRSVYFQFVEHGKRPLARQILDGEGKPAGALERLIGDGDVVTAFDVGPGGQVAAVVDRSHHPPELYLRGVGAAVGTLEPLTHLHDALLAELELGQVERFTSRSADGTRIEGFVVLPPDFEPGRRYPTLLNIHGGPMAQFDGRFADTAQVLAAQGYVVLRANPRGSTGRGGDFTYAIWQDWGNEDSADVLSAVDHAVEKGWSDPDRLGVYGWSYGAMLTFHVLVRTQRFDAAVAGAGTALYLPNYGHDHYQVWWEEEFGLPWRNEPLWRRLSPFFEVEKITTPTLLTGGEHDWNVPIMNSEQLYQALRRLGVPSQLVVYPDEHHNLRRPSFRQDLMRRHIDWFKKHLQ